MVPEGALRKPGSALDEYSQRVWQHANRALHRLSDRLGERRGPASG